MDDFSFPIAVLVIKPIMYSCEIGANTVRVRSVVVVRIAVVVDVAEVGRRPHLQKSPNIKPFIVAFSNVSEICCLIAAVSLSSQIRFLSQARLP